MGIGLLNNHDGEKVIRDPRIDRFVGDASSLQPIQASKERDIAVLRKLSTRFSQWLSVRGFFYCGSHRLNGSE